MDALPDRDYGIWMAEGYAKTAWEQRPRLEAVLADIGTTDPAAAVIRARYDRVLIPWRGRGGDTFVLCLSLLRKRSVVS